MQRTSLSSRMYPALTVPLGMLLVLAVSAPSTAHASARAAQATYYNCGGSCWNTDPYDTTCASDSQPVNTAYVDDGKGHTLGRVENWYSYRCGTNWAVGYEYSAAKDALIGAWALTGERQLLYPENGSYYPSSSPQPMWTNQTFAATVTAEACMWAHSKYVSGKVFTNCAPA
ncbi:hypothetical protein IL992_44105 [Microbispora sp. NEAU-D428]|uniref:hypothetical protein n=1 Tax=Microbispora sitophila TaxID=2771537 RepID=UPI0018692E51|nr:hypothetical protein [Microbispora sitophila]MBE3016085.1 hypothetical protein [Microbispora sitophila]